jgi:hypothetical protein
MGQFYINNSKFALATKLTNDDKLQQFADAGYYAIGGNYRQWNGSSFVSSGLETCDDFASTSLPILTSASTSSLSFSSEILSSGDATGGTTVLGHGFVIAHISEVEPVIGGSGVTNIPFTGGSVGDTFTGTKLNLDLNQIYQIRSYATNNIGTNYSETSNQSTLNSTAGNYCFSTGGALSACTTCESTEWSLVGATGLNGNGVVGRGFPNRNSGPGVPVENSACSAPSSATVNFSVFSAKGDTIAAGTQLFQNVEKTIVLNTNNGLYQWFRYNAGSTGAVAIQVSTSGTIQSVDSCS